MKVKCAQNHIHMLVSIPPKMSVSGFMGYRGKVHYWFFKNGEI